MKAVILAAGYATRLYPLTKDIPKCLLSVGGRPILDRLYEKISAISDISETVIVTNAKFFEQLNQWKNNHPARVKVIILNDGTHSNETRIGAVGDLALATKHFKEKNEDVLMMASDNLFDQNLADFVASAKGKKEFIRLAVYDLKDPKLAAKKFGVLEVNESFQITGMEEKPDFPKSSLIGMGLYYFPWRSLSFLSEYLAQKDSTQDAPGYYIRWLFEKGQVIYAFLFGGLWYDIGDLDALEEANRSFEK